MSLLFLDRIRRWNIPIVIVPAPTTEAPFVGIELQSHLYDLVQAQKWDVIASRYLAPDRRDLVGVYTFSLALFEALAEFDRPQDTDAGFARFCFALFVKRARLSPVEKKMLVRLASTVISQVAATSGDEGEKREVGKI